MSSILIQDVSKTFETKDGSVQALKHVSLSICLLYTSDAADEL